MLLRCRRIGSESGGREMNAQSRNNLDMVALIETHKTRFSLLCDASNATDEIWCRERGIKVTAKAKREYYRASKLERDAVKALCEHVPRNKAAVELKSQYLLSIPDMLDQEHHKLILKSV